MIDNDMPYLEGENFTLKLQSRKSLEMNEAIELNSINFIKYKGLVKRSYSWDKTAVKNSLKKGDFSNIGKMVANQHSVFRIKKGLK